MFSELSAIKSYDALRVLVCKSRSVDIFGYTVWTSQETCEWQFRFWFLVWFGLISGILVACGLYYCLRTSFIGNEWISWYVSVCARFTKQPKYSGSLVRSHFTDFPSVRSNHSNPNHTHGDAANVRNDASTFMDAFSNSLGIRAYFVQKSNSDVRNGRAGCRTYYWAKDVSVDYESFAPFEDDLVCINDVDMYLDMPELLSQYSRCYLLSTFQPSTVSHSSSDYSFTFLHDNTVKYNVAGGAEYSHKVWNYSRDMLCSHSVDWFGFHYYTCYNIDRRRSDQHHQLVLLTPVKRFVSWLIPIGGALNGDDLDILRPVETCGEVDYLRLRVVTKDGLSVSTGVAGEYNNATITAIEDDTLSGLVRIGNTKITCATVRTAVVGASQAMATLLTDYHRAKTGVVPDYVYPVEQSIFRYQFKPHEYEPDASPCLTAFMNPLILGCYAPDQTASNEQRSIKARVEDIRSKEIILTPFMTRLIDEWAELCYPEPHQLHPVDHDVVYEKQGRPTQRAILNVARDCASISVDQPCTTFMKKEAYGAVSDPRNITTIPGVNKNNYSRFMYAYAASLRDRRWYAFGKTPLAIAEEVANICMDAEDKVQLTDFSRMDGRVSNALRVKEQAVKLRAFAVEYHPELLELIRTQHTRMAYGRHGTKYNTGFSRLSGSPETAEDNSDDNAFIAFCVYRQSINPITSEYYTPSEAWAKLGIYAGDDGLSGDVDSALYAKVAADWGQVLECETIPRGSPGVSFLARFYSPAVWYGCPDSMCDLVRQLSKLHTTVSLPPQVSPTMKLCEKAFSYFLTDASTPIIGPFCRAVVASFPSYVPGDALLRGVGYYHGAQGTVNEQYPNVFGDWMLDYCNRDLPDFDHAHFCSWLSKAIFVPSLLLKSPLFVDLSHTAINKTQVPAVVNGENLSAKLAPTANVAVEEEKFPPGLCKMFAATGTCKFGDKCKFKHGAPPAKSRPCRGFLAGKCIYGAKCKFAH